MMVLVKGINREEIEHFAKECGFVRIGYNRWVVDQETCDAIYCDSESVVIAYVEFLLCSLYELVCPESKIIL